MRTSKAVLLAPSVLFTLSVLLALSACTLSGCGRDSGSSVYTGVLEGKSVQVPALTGGEVVSLLVDTGQEVSEGDTLVLIDASELRLQREQLSAGLEELEVQREIARTGLEQRKTDFDYVREREARVRELFEKQAAPQQSLDDLRNEAERARSAYEIARQQVRSLDARRRQLDAQVGTVDKKLGDAVITSPMDAMVSTVYYEVGEAVGPMQPVLELIRMDELEVKIYVSETMLPRIRQGQEATVRVDGVDEEFPGRVEWISPKAEFTPKNILTPETRTSLVYAVEVAVSNPDRVLKHGMPVDVVLNERNRNN
ncbi:MAG: efflux RND transporter periplasmic adaptor subunit [Candidatus Eisenbacteria bacterium]|nr:efflux RND transporter periplasmic adaptor subunit [Candidatus Eisenbacteria bacterium]